MDQFDVHKVIKACIEGDRKMQRLLYDHFSKKLYLVAFRYMGNSTNAQDVLQDGFISIFRDLQQFDPDRGTFIQWARKVMINTALQQLRKTKMDVQEIAEHHLVDQEVESRLIQRLSPAKILEVLSELPDGYRTVINLFILEGYSHKEISLLLNCSESTSKSQLFKAKKYLKTLLTKKYPHLIKDYVAGNRA